MNCLFIALCTIAIFLVDQNVAQGSKSSGPTSGLPILGGGNGDQGLPGGLSGLGGSGGGLPGMDGLVDALPVSSLMKVKRSTSLESRQLPGLDSLGGMAGGLPTMGGSGGGLPGMDGLTGVLPIGSLMKVKRSTSLESRQFPGLDSLGGMKGGLPGMGGSGGLPGMDGLTGALPIGSLMKAKRSTFLESRQFPGLDSLGGMTGGLPGMGGSGAGLPGMDGLAGALPAGGFMKVRRTAANVESSKLKSRGLLDGLDGTNGNFPVAGSSGSHLLAENGSPDSLLDLAL